jgi:chromosome segregation ATPase
VIFRRKPFAQLIERQLELVALDDRDLLDDVEARRRDYAAADREDAEEAFGDYQLALEAFKDRLVEIRDTYAATLSDPDEYERAFERAAVRRWPDIEAV